ncbi:ATP-grasp domain-containing protein [Methanobrevibacter boviskoreani]|uniref:ATP-grasp domain-containing protein n=1 Tax=Methanobrevibacter boviskoreani TaxID=1348249 RepID=UPI0023A91230|nr:ATP-grasp domain-containing protein [Methanobrevibacter boviskoreani]MCI6775434.1 ATP-grasp domain-containing protein [Methanobrevibacter boviskoreani]
MSYDLSSVNENSILVFEYYTSTGLDDLCISSEAAALVSGLVDDLKDEDVYFLLSKKYSYLADGKDANIIVLDEDKSDNALEDFLIENVRKFKKSIFIASEEENNLYDLTKFLEDNDVKLYVSNAESTGICSDKFKMYQALKSDAIQPFTYKITLDSDIFWKKPILFNLKSYNMDKENYEYGLDDELIDNLEIKNKFIAKPINGVDCEDIKIIESREDIDDLENVFAEGSDVLIQEYIEGEVLSVSLISDGVDAIPLSLNKQFVTISKDKQQYLGGQVLYNHPALNQIFDSAVEAVKAIEGLKGFIGVDLIANKKDNGKFEVYIIEINSRFTTPYVGLRQALDMNIGQTIIDLIDGKISIEDIKDIPVKYPVKFYKKDGLLKLEKA